MDFEKTMNPRAGLDGCDRAALQDARRRAAREPALSKTAVCAFSSAVNQTVPPSSDRAYSSDGESGVVKRVLFAPDARS